MTFVIKQITQRAGGGTIERVKTLDQETIVVGRAVGSDIQLGDLAVQLVHVRLRESGGGRIEVEPVDGAAVQIDRKLVGTVQLSLARAPVLIVGGEKIEIGAGTNPGEIAIKVERLEAPAELRDERAIFTLGRALPSRRLLAWGLVAAVLALFLAWPILAPHPTVAAAGPVAGQATAAVPAAQPAAFHPDQTWDAGPLSPPHKFLSKNCAACHAKAFVSVTDATCLTCHAGKQAGKSPFAVLRDHADPKRLIAAHGTVPGFAAKLRAAVGPSVGLPEWRCTGCHKEHVGADTTPVSSDAFCAGCHSGIKARLADTKLADVTSWDSHPQFRPVITDNSGATPKLTRIVLDGHQQEDSGLKFPHALHLSASNAVAQMTRRLPARYDGEAKLGCADCHHTEPTGVRFVQPTMERDCAACHTLAFATQDGTVRTLRHGEPAQVIAELRDYARLHGGAATAPIGRMQVGFAASRPLGTPRGGEGMIRAVFEKGGACYDCHVITPVPGRLAYAVKPVTFTARYLTRGWFSHADHATAASPCSSCHAMATSNSSTALLLPGVKSCQSCHAVRPAANQVASPCSSCHSYHNGDGAPAFVRSEAAKSPLTTKTAASTIDKQAGGKPDVRGAGAATAG